MYLLEAFQGLNQGNSSQQEVANGPMKGSFLSWITISHSITEWDWVHYASWMTGNGWLGQIWPIVCLRAVPWECDRLRPIRFDITEIYVEIIEDEGCGDVAENSTSQANCLIITISCLVGTNLDVGYEKFWSILTSTTTVSRSSAGKARIDMIAGRTNQFDFEFHVSGFHVTRRLLDLNRPCPYSHCHQSS